MLKENGATSHVGNTLDEYYESNSKHMKANQNSFVALASLVDEEGEAMEVEDDEDRDLFDQFQQTVVRTFKNKSSCDILCLQEVKCAGGSPKFALCFI